MPKSSSKMKSWQVFHYSRKYLGRSALYAIFGKKHARAVDRWCEDPAYTCKPDGAYDPIHGVKELLTQLDDQGHTAVVRSALQYITSQTTIHEGNICEFAELLPTITEEILADFVAVADLQRAIEGGSSTDEVIEAKNKAVSEIERTVARYIKDAG